MFLVLALGAPIAQAGLTFRLLLKTSNQSYTLSAFLLTNSVAPDAPLGAYFL